MKEHVGDRMNEKRLRKHDYEAIGWGAIFIWWGITELFPSLPAGSGLLGLGLILLGLNAARYLSGIPTIRFSVMIGILAVLWGALELGGGVLNLPFEIPVYAILLMAIGIIILAQRMIENRNERIEGMK